MTRAAIVLVILLAAVPNANAREHEAGPNEDGIKLRDLVLPDRVQPDTAAWARFTIENHGDVDRWVDAKLYVNGVRRNATEMIVNASGERTTELGFIVRVGTNAIEIRAGGLRLGPQDIIIASDDGLFQSSQQPAPSPPPAPMPSVSTPSGSPDATPSANGDVRITPSPAWVLAVALALAARLVRRRV